jgi:hypothetical protein
MESLRGNLVKDAGSRKFVLGWCSIVASPRLVVEFVRSFQQLDLNPLLG